MGVASAVKTRINKTSRAIGMATDFGSKAKVAFAANWFALAGRFGLPSLFPVNVNLQHGGRRFAYQFSDMTGLDALFDILGDGEYEMDLAKPPDVIFDVGSNVGAAMVYFMLKYPTTRLCGFEPDPVAYKHLQRNAEQFPGASVQNIAVSDEPGEAKFYYFPGYSASSSLLRRSDRQRETIVPVSTLDRLMQEMGISRIDILKFDVEGAEVKLFRNFQNLHNVGRIIGELHLDLIDISKQEFLDMFDGFEIKIEEIDDMRYIVDMVNPGY